MRNTKTNQKHEGKLKEIGSISKYAEYVDQKSIKMVYIGFVAVSFWIYQKSSFAHDKMLRK